MDKTGENYIIYDHQLKKLYKISRMNKAAIEVLTPGA